MKLIQKKILASKEFQLTETEISIKSTNTNDSKQYTIKLDQIGSQIYYHSNPPIIKGAAIALCIIMLLMTTFGYFFAEKPMDFRTYSINIIIWAVLMIIMIFYKRDKNIHIIGGQYELTFYQNLPDKKTVNEFISAVLDNSKKYIISKYARIDPDLSEDQQINSFYWLYTNNLISVEEYEELKTEYKLRKLL